MRLCRRDQNSGRHVHLERNGQGAIQRAKRYADIGAIENLGPVTKFV